MPTRREQTSKPHENPLLIRIGESADPVRMSCQAAIPLGPHAAETILHLINGTKPKPVRPKFTGQCISLERHAALWQQTTLTDTPIPLIATARTGALIKEQFPPYTVGWCRHGANWGLVCPYGRRSASENAQRFTELGNSRQACASGAAHPVSIITRRVSSPCDDQLPGRNHNRRSERYPSPHSPACHPTPRRFGSDTERPCVTDRARG